MRLANAFEVLDDRVRERNVLIVVAEYHLLEDQWDDLHCNLLVDREDLAELGISCLPDLITFWLGSE